MDTIKLLLSWLVSCAALSPQKYNYFAIGSNMQPATMEALRGIHKYNATPAVLLDYQLAFNVPGIPFVEPSAASAYPSPGASLHGVLYTLSATDFARFGST